MNLTIKCTVLNWEAKQTVKRNITCFASCEHLPGPDFFECILEYPKLRLTRGIVQVVVQQLKKKKSFDSLFGSVLSPILQLSSHCPSLLCRNYTVMACIGGFQGRRIRILPPQDFKDPPSRRSYCSVSLRGLWHK